MPQPVGLFGSYKPATGLTMSYVPSTEGEWLGGTLTLTISFHRPTPPLVEVVQLNEWASAYIQHVFTHTWDAMKYGTAQQAVVAFLLQCQRLNEEWTP